MRESEDALETLCGRALAAGRASARRFGLSGDEAEDCALGFVQHLLAHSQRISPAQATCYASDAWLRRCASNWTSHRLRAKRRRERRELSLSHPTVAAELAARTAGEPVERFLLHRELFGRIHRGLSCLLPEQYDLLCRAFQRKETGSLDLPWSNSDRQTLWRVRKRLLRLLEAQGLTLAEVDEYRVLLRRGEPASP